MNDIKTIIERIYQDHNPEKIATIPTLLEKYKDRESELLLKIAKKYEIRLEDYQVNDPPIQDIPVKDTTEESLYKEPPYITNKTKNNSKFTLIGVVGGVGIVIILIVLYFTGLLGFRQKQNVSIPSLTTTAITTNSDKKVESVGNGKIKTEESANNKKISDNETIPPTTSTNTTNSAKTEELTENVKVSDNEKSSTTPVSGNKEETIDSKAYQVIKSYYTTLMNKTFDANRFFAPQIGRFVTMRNTTPEAINSYINSSYYQEFINAKSIIENNSFTATHEPGDKISIEYIENGSCFRQSLKKYQHSRVHVKVILNNDFKIVFLQPDKLISNDYSEVPFD